MSPSVKAATSRKRKSNHVKLRTGCATCKTRRVKCDEGKPHCHRCTSTGRACPGYDIFRQAKVPGASESPPASSSLIIQPRTLLVDGTSQEHRWFDLFQKHVVYRFCGIFDDSRWRNYVLCLAVSEPMLLHASLAFTSSTGKIGLESPFTLTQYGKATSLLGDCLTEVRDDKNPHVLLITCLILACLAYLRNDNKEALVHLQGGAAVLQRLQAYKQARPSIDDPTMSTDEPVNAFRRLDINTSLHIPSRPLPSWFPKWILAKGVLLKPLTSLDIVSVKNRLERWVCEVVCFVKDQHETMQVRPMDTEARLMQLQHASEAWLVGFQYMLEYTVPQIKDSAVKEASLVAVEMLRVTHAFGWTMLAKSLSEDEMSYDLYLDQFTLIVDHAAPVVCYYNPKKVPGEERPAPMSLSPDSTVLPALYYTATKCRDPCIRHKALTLLQSSNHREGPWSGVLVAKYAARIVETEERFALSMTDKGCLTTAQDVPERARLFEASSNLLEDDHVLHCKRRDNVGHIEHIWREVI